MGRMLHRIGNWCDDNLVVPKALFFLLSCALYAPSLFSAQYLKDVWLIPNEDYGLVTSPSLIVVAGTMLWTGFADRTGRHKSIMIGKVCLYALSFSMNYWLEGWVPFWSKSLRLTVVTVLYGVSCFFTAAIMPLLGSLVIQMLECSRQKNQKISKKLLGRQKLFATIGTSFVNVVNGQLTDKIGYKSQFLLVGMSTFLFSIVAHFGLKKPPTLINDAKPNDEKQAAVDINPQGCEVKKMTWFESVRVLLGKSDFRILVILLFIVGIVRTVFHNFFAPFMELLVGSEKKKGLISLMTMSRTLSEVPIFLFGDRVLSWFGSFGMMQIALLASFTRSAAYAMIPADPNWAFLAFILETTKGISHSCAVIGGCLLMSDLAPKGAQATAQGLFTAIYGHLASALGGLLSSVVMRMKLSPGESPLMSFRKLFWFSAALSTLGFFMNLTRMSGKRRPVA